MNNISLRKRSNGWEYRFFTTSVEGKRRQISKSGFTTKKQAQQEGEKALDLYRAGGVEMRTTAMSVSDYLDFWMRNYCEVNLKQTTCEGYWKKIDLHIKPALGKYILQTITPIVLQDFMNDMFNKGYSRNTLSVIKGLLSGAFSYAVNPAGVMPTNPMQTVKLPNRRAKAKVQTRTHPREPLTQEQWSKIMARFPEDHSCHIPLMLGYHLGLRLGEAFSLTWDAINFEQRTVTVSRQVQWDKPSQRWYFSEPKYESCRVVKMDPVLANALAGWRDTIRRGEVFYATRYTHLCIDNNHFIGTEGTPIDLVCVRPDGSYINPRVTQNVNAVVKQELGIDHFDFHTLRHTHATMLLEAGASLIDVQERLGHSKVAVTWRYLHDTDKHRDRTAAIIEDIYKG